MKTKEQSTIDLEGIGSLVKEVGSKSYQLLEGSSDISKVSLDLTAALYGLVKNQELSYNLTEESEGVSYQKQGLKRLLVDGFETEQIWQQLQRRNKPFLDYAEPLLANLLGDENSSQRSGSDEDDLQVEEDDLSEEEDFEVEEDEDMGVEEDMEVDSEDEEFIEGGYKGFAAPTEEEELEDEEQKEDEEEENEEEEEDEDENFEATEVDDEFFSLNKMHKMVEDVEQDELNPKEAEEDEDEESEIDFDQALDDDDEFEADQATFKDFFKSVSKDKPTKKSSQKKVSFTDDEELEGAPRQLFGDDDEMDDEEEAAKPSTFERKQAKMSKIIDELEEEIVGAKPWTMMGEATAKNRPLDSLLEEDLEFDNASKPVPVVTVEVTQSLEQLIQQRIINLQFDDVAPPLKDKVVKHREEFELDMEKSKKSLAQVYEDEFTKSTQPKLDAPIELTPRQIKEHEEIDVLFTNLCTKLDALSHAHFTPKSAKLEVKVLHDAPAITVEEKVPIFVSDATRLAPQEIHGHTHKGQAGNLVNKDELTQEERNRLRNRKKRLAKTRSKNNPAVANSNVKTSTD